MSQNNKEKEQSHSPVSDEEPGETITLHRAGKETQIAWDKLRRPHAVSLGRTFQQNLQQRSTTGSETNNNAGGLLQAGDHRPSGDDNH